MEFVDALPVRFHFNGEFSRKSNDLSYVGGTQAMSYIDRDRLSLPELIGHLREHCDVKAGAGTKLHWLFPGSDMSTGLRALVDDKVCQMMSNCVGEDGVADVYVAKDVKMLKTEMPKTGGTIIRCSKCHLPGHNRSTCEKRSGGGTLQAGGSSELAGATQTVNSEGVVGNSQPAGSDSPGNPNATVVLSNTQQSSISSKKRNSTDDVSSALSRKKAKATNSRKTIKSSAHARV